MFVLSVEENHSTAEEIVLACWVFQGNVRIGNTAKYAVELKGYDFGISTQTEELIVIQQVDQEYPVNLPIVRIRKHIELNEMSEGYSGAFNFDPDNPDAWKILSVLSKDKNELSDQMPASLDKPRVYKRIYLFDSQETAQAYVQKLLKENP